MAVSADQSDPEPDGPALDQIRDALALLDRASQRCGDLEDFSNDRQVLADLRRVDDLALEAARERRPPTPPQYAEAAYQLGLCSFMLATAVFSGEQRHLAAARARHRQVAAELAGELGADSASSDDARDHP